MSSDDLRHGDVRADGYRFWGYSKRSKPDGSLRMAEHWLCPEAWARAVRHRKLAHRTRRAAVVRLDSPRSALAAHLGVSVPELTAANLHGGQRVTGSRRPRPVYRMPDGFYGFGTTPPNSDPRWTEVRNGSRFRLWELKSVDTDPSSV